MNKSKSELWPSTRITIGRYEYFDSSCCLDFETKINFYFRICPVCLVRCPFAVAVANMHTQMDSMQIRYMSFMHEGNGMHGTIIQNCIRVFKMIHV